MKKITKQWLEFAKQDLKDAEILFEKKSYKNSAWHCHQAIEKLLKAIITGKEKKAKRTHDFVELLEVSEVKLPRILIELLEELNFFYLPPSYPDFVVQLKRIFQRRNIQRLLNKTKELFKWLRLSLNHLK